MTEHSGPAHESVQVWDLPLRLFHWLLVLAIAVAFLSAEEGSTLSTWHIMAGWVAAILIAFRLVWGFVGGEHARFKDFLKPPAIVPHLRDLVRGKSETSLGHNALGAVSVLLLLTLAAAVVWTGAAMSGGRSEESHEVIAYALLALIGIHVVAVLAMSLWTKENLVGAMITGKKSAARHGGAHDARKPKGLGLLVALIAVAAAAYAILTYDSQAFTPHPVSLEQEGARDSTADED